MYMEKPGDLPSDFDQWFAAQRARRLPPATPPSQLPAGADPVSASGGQGFTLRSGGSKVFAEAAERIGSALGSAHRQLRHGLELVHSLDRGEEDSRLHPSEQDPARQTEDDWAARMMQEIEDAVAEIRRQRGRLISWQSPGEAKLQNSPQNSPEDSHGDWRKALFRIRMRARRMAWEHPARTVAAIAGFCLALGAALRLRRSHL